VEFLASRSMLPKTHEGFSHAPGTVQTAEGAAPKDRMPPATSTADCQPARAHRASPGRLAAPEGAQQFRPYLFRFAGLTFSAMSCRRKAARLPAFRPPKRPPTQEGETGSSEEALARDSCPRSRKYATAAQAQSRKLLERRRRLFVTAASHGTEFGARPARRWPNRKGADHRQTVSPGFASTARRSGGSHGA